MQYGKNKLVNFCNEKLDIVIIANCGYYTL